MTNSPVSSDRRWTPTKQKRVDRLDEETVSHVSSVLLEMVKLANELSGMDNTLTKREALLVCMGFTTGEAYVYGKYRINK